MKKGFFLLLLSLPFNLSLQAAELKSIEFEQKSEVSKLIFSLDRADVKSTRYHISEDKQIIIDFVDTIATQRVLRAFDTSEFSGSVVFVTGYKKPSSKNDLRIAIQLRDNVRSYTERKDNKVILNIENRFGVFSKADMERNVSREDLQQEAIATNINVPKSTRLEDILENLTLSGRKKYVGRKVSFNVKSVAVADILKMIADASGFNIILHKDISELPPLTLNLTNVPWDQALDTIMDLNKLVAMKNGIILSINTLKNATEDAKKTEASRRAALRQERLVTKVFPLSYSTTKDLKKILSDYITKDRGKISEDERTNSLIVKDTPEVIERTKKIIEALDTQTPQVLIQSKIVEVTEIYAKEIGLQQGISFGYDPIGGLGGEPSQGIGTPNEPGTGKTSDGGPGFSFSTAPSIGDNARSLFGLSISRFSRLFDLNFTLQLMESESKGKIISSPKVITQNKKAAVISTKDTKSFQVTNGSGDQAQTSFQEVEANLKLEVTPQVTNEGSINLDINLSKEQFGARPSDAAPPEKQSREIKTKVLVDNGSTIVIGGIYAFEKRESHSGIPFLKDLPLVGWLFRTLHNPATSKNEMIIFLTPRIINQEEAGLTDNT
ncbi:MAG: type IV pilus secretin PilQ [Bdellovibrionales bacterium]|jgi:type IV pilus assembly protein PilQ|nr:type IV pilus secretin PilQ [Bdellovibrionales bacterium]